jgi:hypothetical protein
MRFRAHGSSCRIPHSQFQIPNSVRSFDHIAPVMRRACYYSGMNCAQGCPKAKNMQRINRQSRIADRQSRVPRYDTSEKNVLAKQSHLTPPLYAPPARGRTTHPASIPNLKRTQTNPPPKEPKWLIGKDLTTGAAPKTEKKDTKQTHLCCQPHVMAKEGRFPDLASLNAR